MLVGCQDTNNNLFLNVFLTEKILRNMFSLKDLEQKFWQLLLLLFFSDVNSSILRRQASTTRISEPRFSSLKQTI